MPQVRHITIIVTLLLSSLIVVQGCGDANRQAAFDSESGRHSSDWLPSRHARQASGNLNSCTECHGADFGGGISGSVCTDCHLGSETSLHPLAWGTSVSVRHGDFVEQTGSASCSNIYCHGSSLSGVPGSGPSCTSCHLGNPGEVHPVEWGNLAYTLHASYVKANGTSSCANAACHGPALIGVSESGPSCTSCHMGNESAIHPLDWAGDGIVTLHGLYVSARGSKSCENAACHGRNLGGVQFSGPSCFICHSPTRFLVPSLQ